ncbi:UDP-2,3-diacylglucosamine diphosphatase [Limnohabitans sp.]|jgi:UDP-2,3-diacylglucosamine hydrolase|uniref:UDP-2,3-diacylglucosamine diphosphatase n=1 Tax=Limnohabitans sp. TaxID=1907725 RepID=UPI0037C16B11
MPDAPLSDMPPMGSLQAPVAWQHVDLISDLHLQASESATFEAWRHYMATTSAQAVLILGDLFEVWVGDDALAHDPFLQRCADVLLQTALRLTVTFMPGNRDFLVGPDFLSACGVQALADPTVLQLGDQRVVLSHGDALCLDDRDYQIFRQQVRSVAWQREFLAKPLSERIALARAMRQQSENQKQSGSVYADADPSLCSQWLLAGQATRLVHGHTHRPADHATPPGGLALRQVLSDWSLDHAPERAQVLRLGRDGSAQRMDLITRV